MLSFPKEGGEIQLLFSVFKENLEKEMSSMMINLMKILLF